MYQHPSEDRVPPMCPNDVRGHPVLLLVPQHAAKGASESVGDGADPLQTDDQVRTFRICILSSRKVPLPCLSAQIIRSHQIPSVWVSQGPPEVGNTVLYGVRHELIRGKDSSRLEPTACTPVSGQLPSRKSSPPLLNVYVTFVFTSRRTNLSRSPP